MNIYETLQQRKATRAFQTKPVPEETIIRILEGAGHAPSGTNTQPWQVAVVSGAAKQRLEQKMVSAFQNGEPEKMDYSYYPDEWKEPFKSRRRACGLQLYSTLQIERGDRDKQRALWQQNYTAFGAPVVLFFFMDSVMQTGSYLDYGMFLQSLMLCAVEEGLATCPQAALGQYPLLVKEALNYDPSTILIGGMALGYEDTSALINSYRTPREPVTEFARFFKD